MQTDTGLVRAGSDAAERWFYGGGIHRWLVRSAETDAHRIQVEVREEGTVILKGTVRSWAEREEAERVAWRGAGVTKVENRITIKLD